MPHSEEKGLTNLLSLMRKLRSPKGCPWSKKQDYHSLQPFLLEEAYEVLACLNPNEGDPSQNLCEELGDLLYQIVFLATIAEEKGHFSFNDLLQVITEKIIRRHPHVFSDESAKTPKEVSRLWENIKAQEKKSKTQIFKGIPKTMPALEKAQALSQKASSFGFDWDSIEGVIDKLNEEFIELKEVLNSKEVNRPSAQHELGDLFFTLCNIARFLDISSEMSLQQCLVRFENRFEKMMELINSKNLSVDQISKDQLEGFWQNAKALLKD